MNTYTEKQISDAIKCYEEANAEDPRVVPWAIFSHLEGRCGCDKTYHYGVLRLGGRPKASRFHPGRGDTEFWEDGEWHPYSIAVFQERKRDYTALMERGSKEAQGFA